MRAIESGTVLDANGCAVNDIITSTLASGRLMGLAISKSWIAPQPSEIIQLQWYACDPTVRSCRGLPTGQTMGPDLVVSAWDSDLCDTEI